MSATRTISLKVHFEDHAEAASCLQGLRKLPGASVNVVRGRVTPDEADYDLEIRGGRKPLQRAVRTLWLVGQLPSSALAEVQDA